MIVIAIRNVLAASDQWLGLWRLDEDPYFLTLPIDFWVVCSVIDQTGVPKGDQKRILDMTYYNRSLSEEEKTWLNGFAYDGIFAARVSDCATLGDMDICQEDSNFVRVIRRGDMTDEELRKECAPTKLTLNNPPVKNGGISENKKDSGK